MLDSLDSDVAEVDVEIPEKPEGWALGPGGVGSEYERLIVCSLRATFRYA